MDLFLVYSLIRRLATPFSEWEAFKLGIIDGEGNLLKSRKDLKTVKERNAFGIYDLMVLKMKRLLGKVPGGKSRLASYAAALWLVKEQTFIETHGEELTEGDIEEAFEHYRSLLSEDTNLRFEAFLHEDMSVGSGAIAGLEPDEPPVRKTWADKYKQQNAASQKKKKKKKAS